MLAHSSTPALLAVTDPWGRPLWIRAEAVVVVEGARDPSDRDGDLVDRHPLHPYYVLGLASGTRVYVAADDAALQTALGL